MASPPNTVKTEMVDDKASIGKADSGAQPGTVEAQKLTGNVDEAAAYLNRTEHFEPLTPAEEKRMLRKTDWIYLPMVRDTSIPQATASEGTETDLDCSSSWSPPSERTCNIIILSSS